MAVSVGVAAGLINAGVVFLQLTFPLLIVFLLVALLPQENNAVTWSVVARQLQGSFWPLILQADSTTTSKVKTRVLVFSTASTVGLILLAAAAVMTPLGLYESVTDGKIQNTTYVYVPDLSSLGRATMPRNEYRTSRICSGLNILYNCPGQDHGFSFFNNASGSYIHEDDDLAYISSVPPTNLSEIFGSGRQGNLSTVASALDIQFRTYDMVANLDANSSLGLTTSAPRLRVDQYRKRAIGRFSMFDTYVLAKDYVVVDGLVANMKTGGIGFRNHTVPASVGQGAEWTESLLWMVSETVCIDMNLTYRWTAADGDATTMKSQLVDRGGFVNLSREYPWIDMNDSQTKPELLRRAYKGAQLYTFNLMRYFNVSRNTSYVGRVYQLPYRTAFKQGQIVIERFKDSPLSASILGTSLYMPPGVNATGAFLSQLTSIRGAGGGDLANISHINADGGVMLGGPVSDDNSSEYRYTPGSKWSAPLYSCVSTTKVFIMDVTFYINHTASLSNLVVKHAEPRRYSSNATTPLWAVEDTGFNVSGISPLWGLVDNMYENAPKLWTIRRDYLYLPAGRAQYWGALARLGMYGSDAWASEAPQSVLATVYSCGSGGVTCLEGTPDYSGRLNYPLFLKWQQMLGSSSTIGNVINVIWTDLMINFVTSSRSKLTLPGKDSTNGGSNTDASMATAPAILSSTLVRYRIMWAIPGLVFLTFYTLVVLAFIILLCLKYTTFGTLKSLANQTAVGRAMTIERYQGRHDIRGMPTKAWVDLHGDSELLITKDVKMVRAAKAESTNEQSDNEVERLHLLMPKKTPR